MSTRRNPSINRLNSNVFRAAADDYKKKHYGPSAKNYEVHSALSKVLPKPVKIDTIRLWRYRHRNPQIGVENLEAVNQFLGVDCSFNEAEEENDMMLENKPLTVHGQLVLEIYRSIFAFVDSVTFDSSFDEIEGNYYDLVREVGGRMPFLSLDLKSMIEQALEEIAVPLLDEDAFSGEHTSEIGHYTSEGFFHVDNLPLLVRTHEGIMLPFREKLQQLAKRISASI